MNPFDLFRIPAAFFGNVLRMRTFLQLETKCVELTVENRALLLEKATLEREKAALQQEKVALQDENATLKLQIEQLEAQISHAQRDQYSQHHQRNYDPYKNI